MPYTMIISILILKKIPLRRSKRFGARTESKRSRVSLCVKQPKGEINHPYEIDNLYFHFPSF